MNKQSTQVHEFDLRKINEEQKHFPNREGSEFVYTPMGTNLSLQLFRKVDDQSPSDTYHIIDQVGHTFVTSYFTFGVKVYCKYERKERRLTVFIEDGEGLTKIATYEMEPEELTSDDVDTSDEGDDEDGSAD